MPLSVSGEYELSGLLVFLLFIFTTVHLDIF